jgi:hypothetical protein
VAWVLAHKISNSTRIADKAARLISTYVIVNLVRKRLLQVGELEMALSTVPRRDNYFKSFAFDHYLGPHDYSNRSALI